MASPKKLIILGTGGNSVDILDAVHERNAQSKTPQYECVGFLDDDQRQWGKEIWGVQVLGPLERAPQHVTIANQARIGNHVIILPNSVISHDVVIGDYSCITGGVCVSGLVTIGCACYLGTNSSIIGGVKIGNGCLIGMGTVIRHDVPENAVMVGNPAKLLRKTQA